MKKLILASVVFLLSVMSLSIVYAIEAFNVDTKNGLKTELIYYNKEKAFNGYTMFHPRLVHPDFANIYLIDMEGNVVHTWPGADNPKLMENGNVLARFTEMDWDGKQVWRGKANVHHDTWRIYNKKLKAYTTIGLTRESGYTQENVISQGADPNRDYSGAYADGVVEVDMDGNVIWRWTFLDHVIQDKDPNLPNYVGKGKTIADYPGKLDLNWVTDQSRVNGDGTPGVIKDWQHTNALDYNEELDHIAINAKHWSEFYVIDHGATFVPNDPEKSIELAASDAGDFIYRFGNPSAYQQGDPPGNKDEGDQQMYGSHGVEWIDKGLPGAGNMMLFDNGCYNPRGFKSRIIEINPFIAGVDEKTGKPIISDRFVNPPDAGYKANGESNQVVYRYQSRNLNSFYSYFASSVQRLPNGNNLVCSARHGHLFEVTPDGEVVWEYINPGQNSGIKKVIVDEESNSHSVFRAYRYGPDHPAFRGKDLTPKGKITDLFAAGKLEYKPGAPGGDKGKKGDKGGKK